MSSKWAFCRPSINIIIIITTKLCCSSRAFKSHSNTPEWFKTPMYYYSTIPLQMFTTAMRWLAFTTMVVLALVRLTDPSQTHGLQCFHNYKLSPRRGAPSFIYWWSLIIIVPLGEPSLAKPGNMPAVFGVSVYAFMCHHSIPRSGQSSYFDHLLSFSASSQLFIIVFFNT